MLDQNFNIINETSCSFCLIFWHTFWVMVFVFFLVSVCECGGSLSLSLCVLLEVGGLSWCHWVQQAEPERGPLLAAGARVVPLPQIHTYTGDRREEWHRSDCPTAHSTDTSTDLQSLWTKTVLLDSFLYLSEVEQTNSKRGGKKHGAAQKRKLVDFAGHQTLLFLFRKVLRRKRIFATESKEKKTPVFFRTYIGLVQFIQFLSCVWIFLLLDTCRGETFEGTSHLNQREHFPAGREGKQMKMLEICLKLVGCKSKKGLSSSSSCYLEGKTILLWLKCRLSSWAMIFKILLWININNN